MNVIAHVFRDVGQPDTGLTGVVEEIAGAVMARMARDEGHAPESLYKLRCSKRSADEFNALRAKRLGLLLTHLCYGPMSRTDALDLLSMTDGPYWTRIMQVMREQGWATFTRANGRTTIRITDAGRAQVAGKLAAE